ncbi:MAG: Fic family protein [Oligoflexales bacterium]
MLFREGLIKPIKAILVFLFLIILPLTAEAYHLSKISCVFSENGSDYLRDLSYKYNIYTSHGNELFTSEENARSIYNECSRLTPNEHTLKDILGFKKKFGIFSKAKSSLFVENMNVKILDYIYLTDEQEQGLSDNVSTRTSSTSADSDFEEFEMIDMAELKNVCVTCFVKQNKLFGSTRVFSYRNLLKLAKDKLSHDEFTLFKNRYDSLFAFEKDQILYDIALEGNDEHHIPDQFGSYFSAYQESKEFLFSKKFKLNLASIKKLHQIFIDGSFPVGASERESSGIFKRNENFFSTDFHSTNEGKIPGFSSIKTVDLAKINPYIVVDNNYNKFTISYPGLSFHKNPFEDQRLKWTSKLSANTKMKIKSFYSRKPARNYVEMTELENLNQQVVSNLISNEINEMQAAIAVNKNNPNSIAAAVAVFFKNFVSIHPFDDGNGRIARLLVERILDDHNIRPPLWLMWGEDVELSDEAISALMWKSILASDKFHLQFYSFPQSVESIDFSPLFSEVDSPVPFSKITLKSFNDWVLQETNGKGLSPDKDATGFNFSQKIIHIKQIYRAYLENNPTIEIDSNFSLLDTYESRVQKIRSFAKHVSTPLEQELVTYSWRPNYQVDEILENGILGRDLLNETGKTDYSNNAGSGLYVSEANDATNFCEYGYSTLLKVVLKKGVRVLDLRDKTIRAKLESYGITGNELFLYNPDIAIKYSALGMDDRARNWMVIKIANSKARDLVVISKVSSEDFTYNQLRENIASSKLSGGKGAARYYEDLLKDKKNQDLDESDLESSDDSPVHEQLDLPVYFTSDMQCMQKDATGNYIEADKDVCLSTRSVKCEANLYPLALLKNNRSLAKGKKAIIVSRDNKQILYERSDKQSLKPVQYIRKGNADSPSEESLETQVTEHRNNTCDLLQAKGVELVSYSSFQYKREYLFNKNYSCVEYFALTDKHGNIHDRIFSKIVDKKVCIDNSRSLGKTWLKWKRGTDLNIRTVKDKKSGKKVKALESWKGYLKDWNSDSYGEKLGGNLPTLRENHLLKGKNYRVLARLSNGYFVVKEFSDLHAAEMVLAKIPHPIDFANMAQMVILRKEYLQTQILNAAQQYSWDDEINVSFEENITSDSPKKRINRVKELKLAIKEIVFMLVKNNPGVFTLDAMERLLERNLGALLKLYKKKLLDQDLEVALGIPLEDLSVQNLEELLDQHYEDLPEEHKKYHKKIKDLMRTKSDFNEKITIKYFDKETFNSFIDAFINSDHERLYSVFRFLKNKLKMTDSDELEVSQYFDNLKVEFKIKQSDGFHVGPLGIWKKLTPQNRTSLMSH